MPDLVGCNEDVAAQDAIVGEQAVAVIVNDIADDILKHLRGNVGEVLEAERKGLRVSGV